MAINFSGSSENLVFSSTNIDETAEISFSLWFNQDDGSAISRMFQLGGATTSGFQIAVNFNSATRVNVASSVSSGSWGNNETRRLRASTTVGTWHNVCGTVSANDGSNNKTLICAFLDGVLMTSTDGLSFSAGSAGDTVYIASRSDGASFFNGQAGEAAIWEGIELTAEEASSLASGTPALSIQVQALKFYTNLREIDGVDIITGNTPTVTGTPDTTEHPPITGSINSFVPTPVGGITGTGVLVAGDSTIAGSGQREHTSTGALVADDSTVAASGQREVTGTSVLVADNSVVAGTGDVTGGVTGTGTLITDDSTVSGAGQVDHTGTGSLVADDSVVGSVGTITRKGTGSLVVADSVVSGVGQIDHAGTGSLVAGDAIVISSGIIGRIGTGVLVADDSIVAGIGSIGGVITGTGSLVTDDSTVASTGAVTRKGTGDLIADDSTVSGTGTVEGGITGTGTLITDDSLVSGVGERIITGTGVLIVANSTLQATGIRIIIGSGVLVAQDSQVSGADIPDINTPAVRRASIEARGNTAQVIPLNNRIQQVLGSNRRAKPED